MREDRKRNSIGRSYHSVTFVPFLFLSIIRRIDRIYHRSERQRMFIISFDAYDKSVV